MLPDRLELGDAILLKHLSYSQITSHPSIQKLNKLLSSFNFRQVQINLMRMGLTLSRCENFEHRCQVEQHLRKGILLPLLHNTDPVTESQSGACF